MTVNINLNTESIQDKKAEKSAKKPKSIKKKRFIIVTIVFLILIGTLFLCNHLLGEKTGLRLGITDIFKPIKANPQLQKDSSGIYTNTLIVGIDTREGNYGLQNTDTIMLLSYNHEKNEIILFSIPRDFFVEVPEQGRYSKINSIYAIGESIERDNGLEFLKTVVEEVTNQEIQYYGMVNLAGFKDLIDTLGGIEVDVENPFTDHRYPVEGAEQRYQTISFEAGPQVMDGKTALRFVRSRNSLNYGEGSDFARAKRQQRVIIALRNKVLSSETLLNPKKGLSILDILDKNIKYSDFTNEEVQAVVKILQKEEMQTHSFVLDPNLANFKLITDRRVAGNLYTISPLAGLGNYTDIHEYLSHAYKKPLLYSENPSILIYDVGLGKTEALKLVELFQEDYPYIQIQFMGTLMNNIKGNYLYKTTEDGNDLDSKMEKYFSIEMTEKPDFIQTATTNGDYIILLGSDD